MSNSEELRTYGGWRRQRGIGLFGLGSGQSIVVVGSLIITIGAFQFSPLAAAVIAAIAIPVILLAIIPWDGVPLGRGIMQRWRWTWGTARGYTTTRSGVMATGTHAWQLPGVLAATQLVNVTDPNGDYGMVWNRRSGHMTVTLRCAATSTWLADADTSETWVANWGSWLASLGYLPIVSHVAVTIDTAPDPGSRLTEYVARRIAPHAPASARRVLQRLVDVSPAAAADVVTRVSVTFSPAKSPAKPQGLDDAAAEISRALPGISDALALCGVTVMGRMKAGEVAGAVRSAYDPAARGDVGRVLSRGNTTDDIDRYLDWETCGPVAAVESPGSYQHDSGWSVSWAWHEAPRQLVYSDVLARLLAPGIYARRVTLIYEALSAGAAARVVEKQVNAAQYREDLRSRSKRDQTARDRVDQQRALRAASEEAIGAGVGFMSIFVTTTVWEEEQLGRAVADVEARADTAKIRLRRLWHSQSAGFATTLPCGICPPALATRWPR